MRLYLLVRSGSSATKSIELNGHKWSLQSFDIDNSSDGARVPYSCVSYTWGTGREPSPFDPSFEVSDRTIPALQTFTQHRPSCSGIWIDALCVPLTQPERSQTLESMGYIYAQADEVMVVLSSAASPALTHVLSSSSVFIADLAVLEHEEWVERAWTYQESANSGVLFLTCEGASPPLVPAERFFNSVGYALTHFNGTIADKLRVYPRLNAFEDIMTDWFMAGYQDRAALNVMSNMDWRVQTRAEDHFYAMIGAISTEFASGIGTSLPCEAFMRICEKKGDFSFIYSAAERESLPSRRWRPVPGDLPSILPWNCTGSSQPGRQCDDGLWLDEIAVFCPGLPKEGAQRFVREWLTLLWKDNFHANENLEDAAYDTLQVMGFKGSSQCVTTTEGYFFPFKPVKTEQVLQILVSTTLTWIMGAPGLISYKEDCEKVAWYPGVFIGLVEGKNVASILVGR